MCFAASAAAGVAFVRTATKSARVFKREDGRRISEPESSRRGGFGGQTHFACRRSRLPGQVPRLHHSNPRSRKGPLPLLLLVVVVLLLLLVVVVVVLLVAVLVQLLLLSLLLLLLLFVCVLVASCL